MRKIIACFLLISLLAGGLSSCGGNEKAAPSCEEVVAAYEEAGYKTFHVENEYKDDEYDDVCYVQVWLEDQYESAYFYFFDSEEAAVAMDEQREFHILIYLFTIIYGDPTWVWTKTYGNIEYEYEDPKDIKPFKELIR